MPVRIALLTITRGNEPQKISGTDAEKRIRAAFDCFLEVEKCILKSQKNVGVPRVLWLFSENEKKYRL